MKENNECCSGIYETKRDSNGGTPEPRLFSIHFDADHTKEKGKKGLIIKPDGKADLTNWRAKDGLYDFGYVNDDGMIEHANNGHSSSKPMVVYTSTAEQWAEGFEDLPDEVWCVACNFDRMPNQPRRANPFKK